MRRKCCSRPTPTVKASRLARISWKCSSPKVPTRRIVFHEITEEAVREALEHARDVDDHLVKAQEGRRILDRLYGYTLSPVLWKKVQTGLSAGRVQSVAVRLIVEREEERRAFRKASYWDLEARIGAARASSRPRSCASAIERLAAGKDFDPTTGQLKDGNVHLLGEADARRLRDDLGGRLPWAVTAVDERPVTQRPSPPFTTSTLQQEANRKLGFSADRTMSERRRGRAADDEGLISYHRTDSTTLSQKALGEAGNVIRDMYGPAFHTGPRQYQTKVRNAQEAHEAIRPTDFNRKPQDMTGLDADEARIYELIWKRAIASQMAEARLLRTTVEITARAADGTPSTFSATGKAIQFAGYLRAYVEGSDDPAAELGDQETILPTMTVGQAVEAPTAGARDGVLTLAGLEPKGHETTPPARYTDASLVKRLEDEGIGRPSTYASIIDYPAPRLRVPPGQSARAELHGVCGHRPAASPFLRLRRSRLHGGDGRGPRSGGQWRAHLVRLRARVLSRQHRSARARAAGQRRREHQLSRGRARRRCRGRSAGSRAHRALRSVRAARRGRSGQHGVAARRFAPADFTVEQALELLKAKAEGPRALGPDPATGKTVYVMNGRFGAYVQLGETPEKEEGHQKKADEAEARVAAGQRHRSDGDARAGAAAARLPRQVGIHPTDSQPIVANFGRFGPYIKHGDEFRSLDSDDEVFAVTLDAPSTCSRSRSGAASAVRRRGRC